MTCFSKANTSIPEGKSDAAWSDIFHAAKASDAHASTRHVCHGQVVPTNDEASAR